MAVAPGPRPKPLRGVPLRGSTRLRLLVANAPPFLLDVDSGRITPIGGVNVRGRAAVTVRAVGKDAIVWLARDARDRSVPRAEIYVIGRGTRKGRPACDGLGSRFLLRRIGGSG